MFLTHEQVATRVLRGEHDAVGIAPPRLRPERYLRLVREALGEHALSASDDPEELLRAERFRVGWAPVPRRCGLHSGDLIVMPWQTDPALRALLLHHERAHGWIGRQRWHEATEADVWWQTAAFVAAALEAWGPSRAAAFPWAPAWFVALVLAAEAA